MELVLIETLSSLFSDATLLLTPNIWVVTVCEHFNQEQGLVQHADIHDALLSRPR